MAGTASILCEAKESLVLPPRLNLARSPSVSSAALLGDERQQTLQQPAMEIGSSSSLSQGTGHYVSQICLRWQTFHLASGGTRGCLVWVNGKSKHPELFGNYVFKRSIIEKQEGNIVCVSADVLQGAEQALLQYPSVTRPTGSSDPQLVLERSNKAES